MAPSAADGWCHLGAALVAARGLCVCVFFPYTPFVSAKSLVRTASSIFVLMTASREVFQQQER